MYQRSGELIQLINDRINKSDNPVQQREYLINKLKFDDSEYS